MSSPSQSTEVCLLTLRPHPSKSRDCLLGHCGQACWAGFPEENKKGEALRVPSRDQKREISLSTGRVAFSRKWTVFRKLQAWFTPPDRQGMLFEVSCSSFLCPSFLFCKTGTNHTTACVVGTDGWSGLPQRMEAVKCELGSSGEYSSVGRGRDVLRHRVSVLAMETCYREGLPLKDTLLTKRTSRAQQVSVIHEKLLSYS